MGRCGYGLRRQGSPIGPGTLESAPSGRSRSHSAGCLHADVSNVMLPRLGGGYLVWHELCCKPYDLLGNDNIPRRLGKSFRQAHNGFLLVEKSDKNVKAVDRLEKGACEQAWLG